MKKILTSCAIAVITLVASTASAAPLTLATVGAVDTLIASETLANSGEDTERDWIASVVGMPPATVTYDKTANSGGANWQQVDGTDNLFAFQLPQDSPFFLVKVGNGGSNSHFLFANIGNLDYGVIDFNVFGFNGINIGKISHVGEASYPDEGTHGGGGDQTVAAVPEPASLTLLGLGLAGVRAAIRKRRSA